MSTIANLRSRRSAAQRHALTGVEREINAHDSHSRRKYLREFNEAFKTYDSPLNSGQVHEALKGADIVLIGDYHALPAAQRYAASLIEQRAIASGRPIVLGVETIFARDQHILDEWWRREIDEAELRQRIRFDIDWGYDWAPFRDLMVSARDHAEGLYGLDCMPREDLRKIGARDRHAAAKIAEIRQRHPEAVIFALFGESHLAPGHLPRAVREQLPGAKILTVLQNVDALYWRTAGERADRIEAVRINDEVLCVFTATPLEKYESYRLFLDQWSRCDDGPDFAPTIYNLIDSLARFLEINRHSPHNGTQPKFLVDMLPEIYGGSSDAMFARLLERRGIARADRAELQARVEECGSVYLPELNVVYVHQFQMMHAAEDATRFLHQACQGLPRRMNRPTVEKESRTQKTAIDDFYVRVVEHAVAFFGSRLLDPSRPAPESSESPLSRASCEQAAQSAIRTERSKYDASARELGYRIGNRTYEAYLAGKVKPHAVRRLFLAPLDQPGAARKICTAVVARLRSFAKPLARAAQA